MDLKVKIGRIKLKNPVMAASGTFGYAKEFEGLVDLKKLGAIVTKTITLEPRPGNPMPRVHETASGMLNAIGIHNEGVDNFIEEKLPFLSSLGAPIIVSISGDREEEFRRLAKILNELKSVKGIELNISCPNIGAEGFPRLRPSTSLGTILSLSKGRPSTSSGLRSGQARPKTQSLIAQSKDETYRLVKSVRNATDKTLITKLSPNVTDIVEIARAACRAHTDAVSLVNTFFGMAIDIEARTPVLGNIKGGLSGPCIKPIALRMVYEVAKNIDKPVIGAGGIAGPEDAIEFLIAGARAVQVGTANFVEPGISGRIIKGIEVYLKKNRMKRVGDIIGSLKV